MLTVVTATSVLVTKENKIIDSYMVELYVHEEQMMS